MTVSIVFIDYSNIQTEGGMIPIIEPGRGHPLIPFLIIDDRLFQSLGLALDCLGVSFPGIFNENVNRVSLAACWP